jgi:NAD-dependent dihydropyrimidine dehydrogenase PreA subunit
MDDNDGIYDQLRKKLSQWPVKLPSSPDILTILKMLYKPEEVKFILSNVFTAPYQDKKTAQMIADTLRKPKDEIETLLDDLANRGLVLRYHDDRDQNTYYSLLPVLPGFFEFYLVGEPDENERKKFSKAFERYYKELLAAEIGASAYPWIRVLLAEKNLEVKIELDPTPEILSFEKVSEYIRTSRKIALMNCACRIKSRCEHPLETCLCFDYYADYMVGRGLARYLGVEEAVEKLKEFEASGLVHTTTNCQRRPQFICNCCSCSCLVLRGFTELHNPRCFTSSNFQPEINEDNCNGCQICVEICPMGAIKISNIDLEREDDNKRYVIDEERCIGCGLCASNCEQEAVILKKTRNKIPESTLKGMWLRSESERVDEG